MPVVTIYLTEEQHQFVADMVANGRTPTPSGAVATLNWWVRTHPRQQHLGFAQVTSFGQGLEVGNVGKITGLYLYAPGEFVAAQVGETDWVLVAMGVDDIHAHRTFPSEKAAKAFAHEYVKVGAKILDIDANWNWHN
jgi:hypothetical protein